MQKGAVSVAEVCTANSPRVRMASVAGVALVSSIVIAIVVDSNSNRKPKSRRNLTGNFNRFGNRHRNGNDNGAAAVGLPPSFRASYLLLAFAVWGCRTIGIIVSNSRNSAR